METPQKNIQNVWQEKSSTILQEDYFYKVIISAYPIHSQNPDGQQPERWTG